MADPLLDMLGVQQAPANGAPGPSASALLPPQQAARSIASGGQQDPLLSMIGIQQSAPGAAFAGAGNGNSPAVRMAMPEGARKPAFDPTQYMTGYEKFMAGVGKAFYDVGRGVGNVVTDMAPGAAKYGFSTRADTDQAKAIDAPLMKTGAGLAGNIAGNVAAFAPLAMIPGAASVGGGALMGAATSALQPVGTNDSRTGNAAMGAMFGAALPVAMRGVKTVGAALIDPFTKAGTNRIVGGLLNRTASNPGAVASQLETGAAATPGFNPTVGQLAGDDGLAGLQRTAEAIDPRGFDGVRKTQASALADALRGIAGTPEARAALESARDGAVNPLYAAAKNSTIPSDPAFEALMQRPSMQAAASQAGNLAQEQGRNFVLSQNAPTRTVATGLLDAAGNPLTRSTPAVPASYSGQALHDLKMGLDMAIGSPIPGAQGMQGAQRNAALDTKTAYLDWLAGKSPEYAQAKNTYAAMSQPLNQMDVGQALYNKFVPALAEFTDTPFKIRPDAYATALRNGDQIARTATGLKSATLEGIMSPEQMQTLRGVGSDAAMRAQMDAAGRGVGSDTIQKLSMSNIAAQSGVPNWVTSMARVPGGWVKDAGSFIYKGADERIKNQLAYLLQNPKEAAAAMQAAGATPSQIAEALKAIGQSTAVSLPATANAAQQ